MKTNKIADTVATRVAKTRSKVNRSAFLRHLGGRGAVTVLLGAALSVGGLSESLQHVHFLVEKDLDAVRVVRENSRGRRVVAKLGDGFAANTVFKLSQVLPERYVSRQFSMFNEGWLSEGDRGSRKHHSLFFEEVARISDVVRQKFFADAMPYGDLIHAKAEKYNVDPALVAAVIEQESRFHSRARSQVGARGLMQLMPRTGAWMGARDLYDPEQNIDAGVRYIKYLQQRFDGDLQNTVAAYNAGEGNVRRYNGVPPFRETQHYVRKVLGNYDKRNKQLKQWQQDQRNSGGGPVELDGAMTLR